MRRRSNTDSTAPVGMDTYGGGKWGRYVRAPDFYFDVMREFGLNFVPLGEIAEISRGVTTGCDAFFLPMDMTQGSLQECPNQTSFRKKFGIDRNLVERGLVKVIQAGDGSMHPVEVDYLRTEVHSLREIDRPIARAESQNRLILLVDRPPSELRGTLIARYLRYGETHPFPSKKSEPVSVSERSTCAARVLWYDLTGLVKPSFGFWPKATQYRPLVIYNPERLIPSCRLYYLAERENEHLDVEALMGILNSTIVGFWRNFYGRYTGTEGSLDTMVVDANLIEIPDPRNLATKVAGKLRDGLSRLVERPMGALVNDELLECRSPEQARKIAGEPVVLPTELRESDRRLLDDAVFEIIGIYDRNRRQQLLEKLYHETARYFRDIRVMEIEKMEQRASSDAKRFTTEELASDAWAAWEPEDSTPLLDLLKDQQEPKTIIRIPVERPVSLAPEQHMFDAQVVYFGSDMKVHVEFDSRPRAELVCLLATLGISGEVALSTNDESSLNLLQNLHTKLGKVRSKFESLAANRTSDEKLRQNIVNLMMDWYIHGHPTSQTFNRETELVSPL